MLDAIFREIRNSDAAILERKGSPNLAMATAIVQMVESILQDRKRVLCVSSVLLGEYSMRVVSLSVPTVLGRKGIDRLLKIELSDLELANLLSSGCKIEEGIRSSDFAVRGALRAS